MFITAGLVALWLVMISVTARVRNHTLSPKSWWKTEHEIGHILMGLIWPVYLPLLLSWAIGTGRVKLKLPKLRLRKQRKTVGELAPGVPDPVFLLAEMAKASLIAECVLDFETLRNDKVSLRAIRRGPYAPKNEYVYEVSLKVGGKKFTNEEIPDDLKQELVGFQQEVKTSMAEKDEAARLAEIRMRALDGIEELLTIDTPE